MKKLFFITVLTVLHLIGYAASVGTGDFNTNQFAITGLSKVSLLSGAFITNAVFNNFTINGITYKFPLTNCADGQFFAVSHTGTNELTFFCTNNIAPNIVVNTIEELVASDVPLPGVNYIGRVLDTTRGGDLAYLPNSTTATNIFNYYASTVGPGEWVRFPYSDDIRLNHGAATGFDPTNATLVAAFTIQSTNAFGRVIVSGLTQFLHTDDVPLLDNNVLYSEDGAQVSGLVLSANGKTNFAVYGGNFIAAAASPTTKAFYITNSFGLIQSPKFSGYSGDEIAYSGVNGVEILTFDANGFKLRSGSGTTNLVISAASGWTGTGTNFLADDGTVKPMSGSGGTTINPTNGFVPYRVNSTTFADSPWYRISANAMGFASTDLWIYEDGTDRQFVAGAGNLTTTASEAFGIGKQALASLTSGIGNAMLGARSGLLITTGSDNLGIGKDSLEGFSTGTNNTGVGRGAFGSLTLASSRNIGMGIATGYGTGGASLSITNGHDLIFVGGYIGALSRTLTNAVAIGNDINVKGNNTAQIGANGITVLYLNGSVGWFRGSGSPEGVVTAPIGSYFTREDGGAGTSFYVKESGAGNTGWVAAATGGGSGITGSGTADVIPKWTAGTVQGDSTIGDAGAGTVTIGGDLAAQNVTATNNITASVSIDSPTFRTDNGEWNATTFDPETRIRTGGNLIDLGGGPITNALSFNNVVITAPASTATLTIASGKTLTQNQSITHNGTDGTTMTYPTTSATIARTDAAQTFTGTQTISTINMGSADGYISSFGTFGVYSGNGVSLSANSGVAAAAVYHGASGGRGLQVPDFIGMGAIPAIPDLVLGRSAAATLRLGNDAATATAQTIKAHDGSGTDKAGANLTIAGGNGTGTGIGGSVIFRTTPASTTGSSQNAPVDRLTIDSNGSTVRPVNSIASAPAESFTGTWFTGGSATTTKPHMLIEPSGTTSTAWSVNGTGLGINQASGGTANGIDIQLNGVSVFKVTSAGNLTAIGSATLTGITQTGTHRLGGSTASFPALERSTEYVNIRDAVGGDTGGLMINSGTPILGVLSATATLDFGSILAAASADLTITITGAAVGDSVHLGLPAAPDASVTYNGFVSAANTVTVRAFNIGAIAADPASATYRATVMKF